MLKSKYKNITIFIVIFAAGILTSWLVFKNLKQETSNNDCGTDYKLINPTIICELSKKEPLETFDKIHSKLKASVDYSILGEKATKISIFFRDLKTRQWFGVNENENYAPASLLKLPLLVAYYKLSEIQPNILSEKYTFNGQTQTPNEMQDIKPESVLEKGKEYAIEELLYRMIVYSDNEMVDPLSNLISANFLNKVFIDLGVYIPTSSGPETDFLSPKIYAAIFRTLYNTNYLIPANSEKVLDLLTKTKFNDALVAGIPKEVKVAHKFGEREIKDENNDIVTRNLYDCGIIFHSQNPYILCVMTKGDNWDNLREVIKNISYTVYLEIDKLKD